MTSLSTVLEPAFEHPDSTARSALPDFSFASGHWQLAASGGTPLEPLFASDHRAVAREVMATLAKTAASAGRSHIVYGLIPFDTQLPAQLRMTDAVRSTPRAHPRPPTQVHTVPRIPVPDSARYRRAVARVLEEIDAGTVEKVVLARSLRSQLPEAPNTVSGILDRLAAANPRADVFHMRQPDGSTWLGASPEIVADVHNGTLVTHPLAGSRPRRPGEHTPDREFALASKDLREHAHVLRHIRAALRPLVRSLDVPAAPSVVPTDSMWHLGTRITGNVKPGVSALEVALALHPTPAVCGTPTAAAAALIAELEDAPRGFYSGLVGWTDAAGAGRWSLVLRSGHVADGVVTLHAGAGIVGGSDPAAEHAETAAKFGTMLRALEGIR